MNSECVASAKPGWRTEALEEDEGNFGWYEDRDVKWCNTPSCLESHSCSASKKLVQGRRFQGQERSIETSTQRWHTPKLVSGTLIDLSLGVDLYQPDHEFIHCAIVEGLKCVVPFLDDTSYKLSDSITAFGGNASVYDVRLHKTG
jgi:hypothetical protein